MSDTGVFEEIVIPVRLNTDALERQMRTLEGLGRAFSTTMSRGLADALLSGRRLSDVLRGIAMSLSRLALRAALRPLTTGLGDLVGALMTGVMPAARGRVLQAGAALRGYAAGGMVRAGRDMRAFAAGGIVSRPTVFPMARGLGLMGEAGPEAILPLKRGPDGRLGVAAQASGAATVHVTMHITTPDAEGFRRNKGRIAAELARAVAEGQRHL